MNIKGINHARNFSRGGSIIKKWINIYWGQKVKKLFFKYLIEDWMSSGITKKYLLKVLAIAVEFVRVVILSMMVLGDV